MPDESDGLPLADFIAALRAELRTAALEQDPDLQFNVGPVTVELTLTTHHEGGGKAGIRFWVVDAGVSGSAAKDSTQRMTLALTPMTANGEPWRVADKVDDLPELAPVEASPRGCAHGVRSLSRYRDLRPARERPR
jgi:hypothetical protein